MNPTDEQLIARFIQRKEQAAIDELVCRHSEMVLKVCRNMLPQLADVEDAFQATFLVFARKIHTLRTHVRRWLALRSRRAKLPSDSSAPTSVARDRAFS